MNLTPTDTPKRRTRNITKYTPSAFEFTSGVNPERTCCKCERPQRPPLGVVEINLVFYHLRTNLGCQKHRRPLNTSG